MAPPEKQELARLRLAMVPHRQASVSLLRLDFGWFGDSQTIDDITFHI